MNIAKYKKRDILRMYRHYARSEKDVADMELKLPAFNPIDPTLTKYNYNLHKDKNGKEIDMLDALDELQKKYYSRNDETVIFSSLCITYPEKCGVSKEEFFKNFYDIARQTRGLSECVGSFVHMDENTERPTMHYIFAPIDFEEIKKTKRVKEYDEKKQKEVSRKKTISYDGQFNAKMILNRKYLQELHPYFQRQFDKRNIDAEILTPERREYNKKKEELKETYAMLIRQNPEKKEEFVHLFFEDLRAINKKMGNRDSKKSKDFWFMEFQKTKKEHEETIKKQEEAIAANAKEIKNQKNEKDILKNEIADANAKKEKTIGEAAEIKFRANKKAGEIIDNAEAVAAEKIAAAEKDVENLYNDMLLNMDDYKKKKAKEYIDNEIFTDDGGLTETGMELSVELFGELYSTPEELGEAQKKAAGLDEIIENNRTENLQFSQKEVEQLCEAYLCDLYRGKDNPQNIIDKHAFMRNRGMIKKQLFDILQTVEKNIEKLKDYFKNIFRQDEQGGFEEL